MAIQTELMRQTKYWARHSRSRRSLLASSAAGFLLAATSAAADETEVSNTLDVIIVTAQKKEQNINDVPLAISVFNENDLDTLRIDSPGDVGKVTPGMFVTTSSSGAPIFALRGVGMNNGASNQNPAVTAYIDEIAIPSVAMLDFQLFDLERVEVLKGPQGTLYGRNVTGGAINFITKKPTRELDGFLKVGYARFDEINIEGAIGGPISDQFAGRFAAYSKTRDGYQTIIKTGPDFNPDVDTENGEINRQGFRASLLWEPSENITWSLQADGHFNDSETLAYQHAGNVDDTVGGLCSYPGTGIRDDGPGRCVSYALVRDAVGGTPVTGVTEVVFDEDDDPYTVFGSFTFGNKNTSDTYGINSNLSIDLGTLNFTSVTGYRDMVRLYRGDNGSPFVVSDTLTDQEMQVFSQEFRLASDQSKDVTWLLGLYYSIDKIDDTQLFNFRDHASFSGLFDSNFTQDAESLGAFVRTEYNLTDKLKLSGGLRYTEEQRDFAYDGAVVGTGAPVPVAAFSDSIKEGSVSGRIGIDYFPTNDTLLYASVAKGFKGPGFPSTISFSTNQLAPFNSESLWAYEAGAKIAMLGGKLQWNSSAYYYDWQDFQATTSVTREGIRLIVLSNAGDVEIYGIESDITYNISDEFTIRAGGNFMHSKVVSGDRAEDDLLQTPEFSGNIRAAYDSSSVVAGVFPFVYVDYDYRTEVQLAFPNQVAEIQDGYGLLGIKAGIRSEDEKWEVSAYARNVTDKRYLLSSFGAGSTFLPGRQLWAEPITYGVTVNRTF